MKNNLFQKLLVNKSCLIFIYLLEYVSIVEMYRGYIPCI
jgi:hypothetical protein